MNQRLFIIPKKITTDMQKNFNPLQSIQNQRDYTDQKKEPHFAPHDGICYYCSNNIYERQGDDKHFSGISTEEAGQGLITSCPHCHYSYCD